ncbi:hypothetical protein BV20DRAFT_965032 [Pilatotrama ljubarskyi]|nr:hypothetical protein BV20DRAFT_965032 [Pilatotrama ljubarskyi]
MGYARALDALSLMAARRLVRAMIVREDRVRQGDAGYIGRFVSSPRTAHAHMLVHVADLDGQRAVICACYQPHCSAQQPLVGIAVVRH